jgi:hypothetical protein
MTSTGLRCAIKLGIPTAIHHLGGVTSLPDLITALSIPPAKLPFLRRLMRMLVTTGVFAKADSGSEGTELFRLNALSSLLVDGVDADEHHCQTSFVLAATSSHYLEASLGLADWFKKDFGEGPPPSPFEEVHGAPLLDEKTASICPELDKLVIEGVEAHDNLGIGTIMRECHDLFKGLESLTDCCGGDGTTARAIIKAHPHLKCNVLDLPKVIEKAPAHDVINFVAGDMFHTIPPAQAVMLKVTSSFSHASAFKTRAGLFCQLKYNVHKKNQETNNSCSYVSKKNEYDNVRHHKMVLKIIGAKVEIYIIWHIRKTELFRILGP